MLDSRVLSKSYGRIFLRSLPQARVFTGSDEEVLREMESFFKNVHTSPSDGEREADEKQGKKGSAEKD